MQRKITLPLLFLTFAVWISIDNYKSDYWCRDRHFEEYQEGVVKHTIYGPLAYRVMIPYTVDFLYYIFSSKMLEDKQSAEKKLDTVINIIVLFFTQILFYKYLRNFFNGIESLFGTLWLNLAIIMSLTSFIGVHVYETGDIANLLFVSLALHLFYKQQWKPLALVLFVSMINRETPAFLLIPICLFAYRNKIPFKWPLLCIAAVIVPYAVLKLLIHPPQPSWFLTIYLNENLPFYKAGYIATVLKSYLKFIVLLGIAAWLALTGLKQKNQFLRTLLIIVPFFIPIHFVVGHVEEFRLWVPLLLIFIPLAMETLKFQSLASVQKV